MRGPWIATGVTAAALTLAGCSGAVEEPTAVPAAAASPSAVAKAAPSLHADPHGVRACRVLAGYVASGRSTNVNALEEVTREAKQAKDDGVRTNGARVESAAAKVRTASTGSDRAELAESLRLAVIALTDACNAAGLP